MQYPQKQLDANRYVNVDNTWWHEHIKEQLVCVMAAIGVYVEEMYFSGFWSQGDGACFSGFVDDWGKYLGHLGYTDSKLHTVADDAGWMVSWKHSGHYYHENCVQFSFENFDMVNPFDEEEDPIRYAVWQHTVGQTDMHKLERDIVENLKDHMRKLYKDLEAEYEYLTSDEVVAETLDTHGDEPECETEELEH